MLQTTRQIRLVSTQSRYLSADGETGGAVNDRRSDRPTGLSGSGGNKATLEFPRHSELTAVSLSQNLHMGHLRVFIRSLCFPSLQCI